MIGQKVNLFWSTASDRAKKERLESLFDCHVIRKDGCWDWEGSLRRGYGRIKVNGKAMGAHRISWIIHNGDIPEGMFVCHKCDNKLCTNPKHLFLGSAKDNTRDMVKKERHKGGKGEGHGQSKLTVKNVKKIKELLDKGVSVSDIASFFKVGKSTIDDIKFGRTWKDVK